MSIVFIDETWIRHQLTWIGCSKMRSSGLRRSSGMLQNYGMEEVVLLDGTEVSRSRSWPTGKLSNHEYATSVGFCPLKNENKAFSSCRHMPIFNSHGAILIGLVQISAVGLWQKDEVSWILATRVIEGQTWPRGQKTYFLNPSDHFKVILTKFGTVSRGELLTEG